jgi:hypothetical protein
VTEPRARAQQEEIQRFLATGDNDLLSFAWEGGIVEGGRWAKQAMLAALLAEVKRRSRGRRQARVPESIDLERFVRSKVEPMARGLFPRAEQETILEVLERSIVFVTAENLESALRGRSFLRSAWDIANLYLASIGAALLGKEARPIVGLSEETTCFASPTYFDSGTDRFSDFVLHETAHIFHNCKRGTVGLPPRGRREWLLDLDFRMRETFAYACEAYGLILELGDRPADRRRLLAEHLDGPMPGDDRVDEEVYRSVVTEAVGARNGWKRILSRCAPRSPVRNA